MERPHGGVVQTGCAPRRSLAGGQVLGIDLEARRQPVSSLRVPASGVGTGSTPVKGIAYGRSTSEGQGRSCLA